MTSFPSTATRDQAPRALTVVILSVLPLWRMRSVAMGATSPARRLEAQG